ncbi:MAG TPA: hypothetical protein PKE37_00135 [Thiomonas arsenitoxydans]|uniref:hypothetical protein n=1 Tax=Thiomonas TaxID=32012 RepID=UPI00257FB5D8|nr:MULTISPECIES: hypothetical protein [Thiomonas]HML80156.1 hypothetical protein [Thiomonas arsenitoxydans]
MNDATKATQDTPSKLVTTNAEQSTRAALVTSPAFRAAGTIAKIEDADPPAVYKRLQAQAEEVSRGDLSTVEAQLLAQMQTLNSVFHKFTAKALDLPLHHGGETYMRLALKAQIQATRTAEVLGNLKNAPVILANQLNMAQNQQVNNHPAANSEPAQESKETNHARRKPYRLDTRASQTPLRTLDTRAPSRASRTHPADSAVENPRSAENAGGD